MKLFWTIVVAAISLAVFVAPARAQGVGVRVGASADPDQFYAGAHLETGEVAEGLRFRPNVEVGVGDNVTLVALNFELVYRLRPDYPRLPGALSKWHLYVGAGPALNIFRFSNDTRAEGGFNGLIGLAHADGLFVEAKVGVLKSPDFKVGLGYTFHP
jgi:hypothetical protein